MGVKFVIGRSRSGKTSRFLDQIVAECRHAPMGAPLILLVPEQATYSYEKALLEPGRLGGFTRVQVLSFTRLQEMVFAESPAPQMPRLSATHRDVLVTLLVARDRRENPDGLVSVAGIEEALADFVSESKQQAVGAADFRRTADTLEKVADPHGSVHNLATKLRRLARLLDQYTGIIQSRFEDPQDTLLHVAETIRHGDLMQGSRVFVDGFIAFTPVEEKVLLALAQRAAGVQVALPGDPARAEVIWNGGRHGGRHPVFSAVEETLLHLKQLFDSNGVALEPPELLATADTPADVHVDLCHVERGFLVPVATELRATCEAVSIHETDSIRDEARVAVEILKQWMNEHQWQPGDVGILARNLDSYAPHLREAFTTLRMPYFLDRSEPLETHPLVLGVRALIRCDQRRHDGEELLNLARSGFLPMERRAADALALYLRRHPRPAGDWFRRDAWEKPQPRVRFDPDEDWGDVIDSDEPIDVDLDAARQIVAGEVRQFQRDFRRGPAGTTPSPPPAAAPHPPPTAIVAPPADPLAQITAMPLLGAPRRRRRDDPTKQQLDMFAMPAEEELPTPQPTPSPPSAPPAEPPAEHQPAPARPSVEDRNEGPFRDFVLAIANSLERNRVARGADFDETDLQILGRIGELFAEAIAAAGDEVMPWELAGDLVNRILARLVLPRIPPMLNEVFVGQVDRSRQPRLRGVVVLGLNEGAFPRVGGNNSLLNDSERELLEKDLLVLRPSSRRLFEREALWAYRAMTTASQRLALMRPRKSESGAGLNASPFLRSVQALFHAEALPVYTPATIDDPARCWRARELMAAKLRRAEAHTGRIVGENQAALMVPAGWPDGLVGEAMAVARESRWRNHSAIPEATLASWLGHRLRLSASQLESFAACPFRHFVGFLLRPEEPMAADLEHRDAGSYAHAVLRGFTRRLRERRLVGSPLQPAQVAAIVEEASAEPRDRMGRSGLLQRPSMRHEFARLDQQILRAAIVIADAFVALRLSPAAEEVSLGEGGAQLVSQLPVPLARGEWSAVVRGKIDRIDNVGDGQNEADQHIVVDYKLTPRGFDFRKWQTGESVQLPIYLLAVGQETEAIRAEALGALYFPISVSDEEKDRVYNGLMAMRGARTLAPQSAMNQIPHLKKSNKDPEAEPSRSGPVIADVEFDAILRQTLSRVTEIAGRIASGCADVRPTHHGTQTACKYCSYRGICQLDYAVNKGFFARTKERNVLLAELRAGGGRA